MLLNRFSIHGLCTPSQQQGHRNVGNTLLGVMSLDSSRRGFSLGKVRLLRFKLNSTWLIAGGAVAGLLLKGPWSPF